MGFTRICLPALTFAFTALFAFITDSDATPAQPGNARTIFRCEIAGVPTFSDRPCDPAVESRTTELNAVNVIAPPTVDAAAESVQLGKRSMRGNSAVPGQPVAASNAAKADACGRIQQSLRKITSKMRAGYTAKQGERLRARKQDLEEKRRLQKCR